MQRNRPIHVVVQTTVARKEGAGEETETKVAEEEAPRVNAQVVSRVVRPEDVEITAATDDGFFEYSLLQRHIKQLPAVNKRLGRTNLRPTFPRCFVYPRRRRLLEALLPRVEYGRHL